MVLEVTALQHRIMSRDVTPALMISETSRLATSSVTLFFPDQRHSSKMAFTCFITLFNGCFVSFFCLSGFVHVVEEARCVRDNVDVHI